MLPPEAGQTRTRNAAATRAAILKAARVRFAREGYDGASLREIAADAGVDAALVSRYFGSKDDLFREVLSECGPPEQLTSGGRSGFGARAAKMLIIEPTDSQNLDNFLTVLRSTSSARALEIIRATTMATFYGPLEEMFGGDDGAVRARLVAGVIMGFAISRIIDEDHLLDPAGKEALCRNLAQVIQAAVD